MRLGVAAAIVLLLGASALRDEINRFALEAFGNSDGVLWDSPSLPAVCCVVSLLVLRGHL